MRIDKKMLENMPAWMADNKDVPEGWIYCGDMEERYVLGQPGRYNMLIFGVNPSKATPEKPDPTIRKVIKLVDEAGYDGWIMVNLYPLRATKPSELPANSDRLLLKNNLLVLKALMNAYTIGAVWAAWGNIIDSRSYLGIALYDIQEALDGDFEWYHRGECTKRGNPRHPLYMKAGEKFTPFAVADYASGWVFDSEGMPTEDALLAGMGFTHRSRVYDFLEEHMTNVDFELSGLKERLQNRDLQTDEYWELCCALSELLGTDRWRHVAEINDYEKVLVDIAEQGIELLPLGIVELEALNIADKWQEVHGEDDIPEWEDAINKIFLDDECRRTIEISASKGRHLELARDVGIIK